jgi:hypothetical protein
VTPASSSARAMRTRCIRHPSPGSLGVQTLHPPPYLVLQCFPKWMLTQRTQSCNM